jgi:hypothetical protein
MNTFIIAVDEVHAQHHATTLRLRDEAWTFVEGIGTSIPFGIDVICVGGWDRRPDYLLMRAHFRARGVRVIAAPYIKV